MEYPWNLTGDSLKNWVWHAVWHSLSWVKNKYNYAILTLGHGSTVKQIFGVLIALCILLIFSGANESILFLW